MIKECKIHGSTEHKITSDRIRCKKCLVDAVTKRRKKLKLMAIQYKGGKCENCGYDRCLGALEFHHENPALKEFKVSGSKQTASWEKIKNEVDKCKLLCANCHREEHERLNLI